MIDGCLRGGSGLPPRFSAGRGSAAVTAILILLALTVTPRPVQAQDEATVVGRVLEAESGTPLASASVLLEGTDLGALSDSTGRYRIADVPPGPQVLVVRLIGFATARVPLTVPGSGVIARDVELSTTALQLPGLTVTADAVGRARGELGTASVIDTEAIELQSATSLAGVLELIPGAELKPPGLGDVQQFSIRSVSTGSGTSGLTVGGPSAGQLSSFGTLVILDGVPLSNNANLQTTGPRGEARAPSSAGGGIDLRRIPASTIERVEVIRGVPSARYGDLTQGVIVVDTRAGAFEPEARTLFDARTGAGSFLGGWRLGDQRALTGTFDFTRTRLEPGVVDDRAYRLSGQLAHRASFGDVSPEGAAPAGGVERPRLVLDSRADLFQVYQNSPEDPEVEPGRAASNRERGLRVSERARLTLDGGGTVELNASLDWLRQESMIQRLRTRGALPFTDRLTEGRSRGRFIGGEYVSRADLDGEIWQFFSRLEAARPGSWLGVDHRFRTGLELRREANTGAGYQFDIQFPPQTSFNGVRGFDRPRAFDRIPPLTTSALYLDDRVVSMLPGDVALELQAGLRASVLHDGGYWLSGARDLALQPRVNLQVAPLPWLRLRGGWGRTAKSPSLADIFPAPQYFDVVNVNWFTPDPVERLAVLTTFIEDPTNPDLGFSVARKAEAGIELASSGGEASLTLTAFRDRTEGGVGFRSEPGFLLRDRFALTDSVVGDGQPTDYVEPAIATDTLPILLDIPDNNLTLDNRGWELTARFPEFRPLRLRLEVQGAWIETELFKEGLDFGFRFRNFQIDERIPRWPFWESVTNEGLRGLMTYRVIHHQPAAGLVITGTVQHIFKEEQRTAAATDTLAFEGYITRSGELVRVPAEQRTRPEFSDLRIARSNVFAGTSETPADWLMSLQVSLTLPLDGRLSFYAYNVLDRPGKAGGSEFQSRFFPPLRFGLEGAMSLDAAASAVGGLFSSAR